MRLSTCAAAMAVAFALTVAPTTVEAATPAPVKNGNLVYVNSPDRITTQAPGPTSPTTLVPGGGDAAKYSPDGKQLAFTRDACDNCNVPNATGYLDVYTRVLASGAERRVARFVSSSQGIGTDFGYRSKLTWSPDGKQVVVSSDHSLVKVTLATGKQAVVYSNKPSGDFVDSPAWSPDGSRIAFSLGGAIKLINPDGTSMRTFTSTGFNAYPDWSPDSRTIAFTTTRFQTGSSELVTLPRSGNGTPVRVSHLTRPKGFGYFAVAWSADGKKIATMEFATQGANDGDSLQVRAYLPDGSHSYSLTGPLTNEDTPWALDWAPKLTS